MKERLIELIKSSSQYVCEDAYLVERIADHLLANGVIVLPCAVGDTVYWVTKSCDENGREESAIHEGTIISFSLQNDGLWFYCCYRDGLTFWHKIEYFGKTVFLTKEAAEKALKEKQQ